MGIWPGCDWFRLDHLSGLFLHCRDSMIILFNLIDQTETDVTVV